MQFGSRGSNHGVDYDCIEAHANLAGMGDFNCRVEIDLSPRGSLSCTRTTFYLLFSYLAVHPSFSCPPLVFETRVSAFSRHGNTYRYYATSLAKPPKSNMKSSAWAKFYGVLLCRLKVLLLSNGMLSCDFIWSLKIAAKQNKLVLLCAIKKESNIRYINI